MDPSKSKKKLLFVLPKLERGGAERVVLNLLKHIPSERFRLHLALIAKAGSWFQDVPEHVTVHNLRCGRIRWGIFTLYNLILRIGPDTVFATGKEANISLCLIKTFFLPKMYLVLREANALSIRSKGATVLPLQWKILYRFFYPRANRIVCLSKLVQNSLKDNFAIPSDKLICINNPLDIDGIRKTADLSSNPFAGMNGGPHIVAAGRLVHEKGFDLLIQSFPKLLKDKKNAHLWILGEGPLALEYIHLSRSMGLDHRVHFPGFQPNVYSWLKHADLFVLSSRSEGLPNVLLEAMACGCPVAVRDHPGGTREIMAATNQLGRISAQIDWKPEWFERDGYELTDILRRYYGICAVAPRYAAILSGLQDPHPIVV